MKSHGQLWKKIISEENLREAWRLFRRFHASKPVTKKFARNLDRNLEEIRRRLEDDTWQPSNYHQFKVYEPKPRTISSVRINDRIVHHALCNVCGPLMDRRFIEQSYACRKRKGSHMACLRARELAAKHPYFLKMDVRHYFETIDHDILISVFNKMFREREVRELAAKIIVKPLPNLSRNLPEGEGNKAGLPIGNLTSQWFANLYLDGLDHFAVEKLRLGNRYLRYMDDMLIFTDSKAEAWAVHNEIRDWLMEHRKLMIKEKATIVAPVSEGVPFLGLRIWRNCWRMRHSRLIRTRRSARRHYVALMRGECSEQDLQGVLRTMEGSAGWFGFKGIYARLDDEFGMAKEKKENGNISGFRSYLSAECSRVKRGGSCNSDNAAGWSRSGSRNRNNTPSNSNWNNGFRLSSNCGRTSSNRGGYKTTTQTADLLHKSHPEYPVLRDAETKMQLAAKEVVGLSGFRQSQSSRPALYFTKSNKRKEVQHEKS